MGKRCFFKAKWDHAGVLAVLFLFLLMHVPTFGQSIEKKSIRKLANKVADWQLQHPNKFPMGSWVQGPFVNGLMAIGKLPHNKKYGLAAKKIGINEKWSVIETQHRANDHCTPQAWIEWYEIEKKPEMIQAIRQELDGNMRIVSMLDDDLKFEAKNREKWSWCDALYMSPPTYARMGKVTEDHKYYDFLHHWWWRVSAFYFDSEENLYYRDQNFFNNREPNGKKIFWSRGNGWVVGGLVRVLQYLPDNDPYRKLYEQQLRMMCIKLAQIQNDNGLWHSGLLDPNAHPQDETSGSAFFVYGMAYGINNGLLEEETFIPVVQKAWTALSAYVMPDGRFTGIQPIGDSPEDYDLSFTMPYGVGAFLLASSEMYRLCEKWK